LLPGAPGLPAGRGRGEDRGDVGVCARFRDELEVQRLVGDRRRHVPVEHERGDVQHHTGEHADGLRLRRALVGG
jgi:hypothetical protein